MQTEDPIQAALPEETGYFPVPGALLYTVLHPAADPVARVLLVGAFASERYFAYHTWVRWARYLASRRIDGLRYDYRGVGESARAFEEMSFEEWSEDLRLLAEWLSRRSP